jgi:hypothetical protein
MNQHKTVINKGEEYANHPQCQTHVSRSEE